MRVLLTGGSGALGGFVAPALTKAGHTVVHLARRPPPTGHWLRWSLEDAAPEIPPADGLVHLALDHVAGAYRGGEGDDPAGFLARNRDGSLALIAAARARRMRVVFLSSRAVYGDARRGARLRETEPPAPDSLYGVMKLAIERAAPDAAALRATGVYGLAPGSATHKWSGLFADYLAGRPVAPRAATELHGTDLAAAVLLVLETGDAAGAWNASDIMLDRADLLAGVRARTGCPHAPPPRAAGPPPGAPDCERLRARGWRPGGAARLDRFLDRLFSAQASAARP